MKRGPHRPPEETRKRVATLRERGLSYAAIARRLGVTKPTVAYHARRLGIPAGEGPGRRYDWVKIQAAYDEGLSVRQCAEKVGFSLSSWHKAVERGSVVGRSARMPIEEVLRPGAKRARCHVKRRLLEEDLKENRCERCGITDWLGQPLSIALHHVNGNGQDNRLENIQFLCPNCHAQTENYAGRGVRRKRRAG